MLPLSEKRPVVLSKPNRHIQLMNKLNPRIADILIIIATLTSHRTFDLASVAGAETNRQLVSKNDTLPTVHTMGVVLKATCHGRHICKMQNFRSQFANRQYYANFAQNNKNFGADESNLKQQGNLLLLITIKKLSTYHKTPF
ncbi:MAG: hypothetical protein R3274_01165 [Desulfobacterales bacterium]|nr:hypothetical protein [Desulfobacterales bacterium]